MKKALLTVIIPLLAVLFYTIPIAFADCTGCCAKHGGVVCVKGITKCKDGTSLSPKCKAKGCNKCSPSSKDFKRKLSSRAKPKQQRESAIEKCVCDDKIIYTDSGCPCEQQEIDEESYQPGDDSSYNFRCNGHVAFGIPGPEEQLLCRQGYAVGYDYETKVPRWVAYRLTPDSVNKRFERSDRFKEDTEIPAIYRATLLDYKGSGYDRGHMAAAATVDFSHEAMQESFLMSNMAPQLPGFNRQGWRELEEEIREWVNERGELYVVTGCMYEGAHPIIGNGVHVPTHFFKMIYDSQRQDAIAFLVPHRKISREDLPGFIVSVDELEQKTGLDFNRLLEDAIENDIEDEVERMW